MTCINCKEDRAHRSHRSGIQDWGASLLGYVPYRCHGCSRRFYAYRNGEESTAMRTSSEREVLKVRRRGRRANLKRQVFAYSCGVVAFLAFLYYIIQPRD